MTNQSIWIARHGNREDFVNPDWTKTAENPYDPGLSSDGIEQVYSLAQRLKGKKISYVFASPFLRTLESAHIIAEILDLPLYVEDGLSEWLNPEWFTSKPAVLPQTLSIQRFPKIEPSYVPQIIPLYPENDEGIMNRMGKVTHKLLSEYKDDLLIVTHGAPIVGIIQELIDREKEVSCPLCSLFKVVKTDQRWVLELNGDTSHLIHTEENVRLH